MSSAQNSRKNSSVTFRFPAIPPFFISPMLASKTRIIHHSDPTFQYQTHCKAHTLPSCRNQARFQSIRKGIWQRSKCNLCSLPQSLSVDSRKIRSDRSNAEMRPDNTVGVTPSDSGGTTSVVSLSRRLAGRSRAAVLATVAAAH